YGYFPRHVPDHFQDFRIRRRAFLQQKSFHLSLAFTRVRFEKFCFKEIIFRQRKKNIEIIKQVPTLLK
ncbi:MAG: hypothetical protein ACI9K1_001799, partial [Arcticibacterium sp.]